MLLPIAAFTINDDPLSILKISFKAKVEKISLDDVLFNIPLFAIARLFSSEIKSKLLLYSINLL